MYDLPERLACRVRPRVALISLGACAGALLLACRVAATFAVGVPPARAGESRCADCHFANPADDQRHLFDWQASRHGRSGVGCEGCHGGDPATYETLLAHRGVLESSDPASPTHFTNLPRTCGRCHPAELEAFERSRHMSLLEAGDASAPSCTSCHSEVGAYLLSTRALEASCRRCHGTGRAHERPELQRLAGTLHEDLRTLRALLASAHALIDRVESPERRAELERAYRAASAPLRDGVANAHGFDLGGLQTRLDESRRQIERLLDQIANPARSTTG